MKTKQTIVIAAMLFASAPTARADLFVPGNLVVVQEGTGSAALTNAGTAVFLDQYTTGGAVVGSPLAIPTASLVNSGTATSEGGLTLSANGQYLVVSGYVNALGTSGVASTTSASVPRGVGTVDSNGNFILQASSNTAFSGNNIRSSTTDGSGNFWSAGATTGVIYMGTGTQATVSTTIANDRIIQDIGGNLYFSTGSGSARGIYEITGTPTSGTNTAVSLINTSSVGTASPYGFAFNSMMNTAYIADSDAYTTSSGVGGIEKWTYNGSAWVFQYSLPVINTTGTGTSAGATGIAVNFSGTNPIIYATSSDGTSLFDITDTGSSSTPTLLASASANEAFRGLSFAPASVPEPSNYVLLSLTAIAFGFWRWKKRVQTVSPVS